MDEYLFDEWEEGDQSRNNSLLRNKNHSFNSKYNEFENDDPFIFGAKKPEHRKASAQNEEDNRPSVAPKLQNNSGIQKKSVFGSKSTKKKNSIPGIFKGFSSQESSGLALKSGKGSPESSEILMSQLQGSGSEIRSKSTHLRPIEDEYLIGRYVGYRGTIIDEKGKFVRKNIITRWRDLKYPGFTLFLTILVSFGGLYVGYFMMIFNTIGKSLLNDVYFKFGKEFIRPFLMNF